MRKLPRGLLSRTAATGRIVGRLGISGARRLLETSVAEDQALGEALFSELDKMKGMAMKVGQILSYLDVGLPEETAQRLSKLQQGAEPYDFDLIRQAIESELGPLDGCFERFDVEPVAAASVGQVHRASIDGREVAVKVRYPDVEATIASDFARLQTLGRIASMAAAVDGAALVDELQSRMVAECDYVLEAHNQRLFGELLRDEPGLRVPRVVDSHSTSAVLTTVWHDGDDFESLRRRPAQERNHAALQLCRFPYLTLLGHGVLQADPHPGNFLFHDGGSITALDFGCVRELSVEEVESFRHLSRVVVLGERGAFPQAMVRAGLAPRLDRLDLDDLWGMMRWQYAPYLEPTFRFERSWWESGLHYSRPTNRNLRHQGLPPHWLWLQRAQFGLHSVLLKLEVEVPLRGLFLELLDRPIVPVHRAA